MRKLWLCLVLNLLWASPAHAQEVRGAFTALNTCLLGGAPTKCRAMLTASSLELYDRITGYDVMDCLPKETTYVSEQASGKHMMVRASTKLGETVRFLRLAFIREKGAWKLDIPFSLRLAIGENWQKQVSMTEQLYLFMRQQLGGKLNCAAVQGLAAGKPNPPPAN